MSGFTRKKAAAAVAAFAAVALSLTACSGEAAPSASAGGDVIDTSTATGEVNYWL